jgi:purine-binding chemotaxis protein CheW
MNNTFLSFYIGNEQYAINVIKVLEVLEKQHITRVPNAPAYIMGIINFRGEVVPVFETRIRFNLEGRSETDSYVIVVIDLLHENETLRIGAIVDRVKDVINIDDKDIKPVPPMSREYNTGFLQGIFKLNNEFILLLDVDNLFSSEEISVLEETNNFKEEEEPSS